ncbi:hypothetical protein G7B40_029945 [Aetokthonos hydrillicola Thurmond2011]|jgi:hypothetical protein|uniref:Uncharacterized protein n=1 Tax=Aetokthonos hydrillicola Thurmond2011 TaxID=2712845 RepID=A0AAP5IBY0_9CYAN|nr:hypothetical protein [Aetokthonos hydrillicola]MBO3463840.1 hypothetical protein [Aetokthonos hydrillicola CCALA 1050]MBW4589190.1 hypothetical protein [Aetokthonos hydrillicola CCALA 1050]MDR9898750.1 hypothetical protein [Aetokthonos hydrillicola Thurmond2011]
MALAESTYSNTLPDIPGYTVVEQLYVGYRASVYRAVEDASQRLLVIKLLQQDYPTFHDLQQLG